MRNVPASLSIITFSRVPAGSFLVTGEAYRVTHNGKGGDVHFRSVGRGCGTFERADMMAFSEWQEVTDKATLCAMSVKADDMLERTLRAFGVDRWSDQSRWPQAAWDWYDIKIACDAAMGRSFAA